MAEAERGGRLQLRTVGNGVWIEQGELSAAAVELPEQERRELHARAARWLTLHLPGVGLCDEWIAEHWTAAGDPQRAAAALRRSAGAHAELNLESEALRLLRVAWTFEQRSLRAARERPGPPMETDLFERRALLLAARSRTDHATDEFSWPTAG